MLRCINKTEVMEGNTWFAKLVQLLSNSWVPGWSGPPMSSLEKCQSAWVAVNKHAQEDVGACEWQFGFWLLPKRTEVWNYLFVP